MQGCDVARGQGYTRTLVTLTSENHINSANLSLEDLGRENPLTSRYFVAHFMNDVVFG